VDLKRCVNPAEPCIVRSPPDQGIAQYTLRMNQALTQSEPEQSYQICGGAKYSPEQNRSPQGKIAFVVFLNISYFNTFRKVDSFKIVTIFFLNEAAAICPAKQIRICGTSRPKHTGWKWGWICPWALAGVSAGRT
jgi:hypothetical protein